MAQVFLTPEGKHNLSRLAKFQGEFIAAVLEYSREQAETTFPDSPVADLKAFKLDGKYRQILRSGDIPNVSGKINSFLVPFASGASVDTDDIAATITAIKSQLADWFLFEAGVNPGDELITGTKDAQTGAWIPN